MKILVIHNYWQQRGGEDEAVEAEIRLLESYGHKVIFYKRGNCEINGCGFFKKLKVLVKDMIWSNKTYRDIKEISDKEKPDIAHIHNIFILISPSVYYALREKKIPIVQTLHNYRFFCPSGIFYREGKVCEKCCKGNFIPAIIHKCWRSSYVLSYFFSRCLKSHFKNNTFKKNIDAYIALSEFSRKKFIEMGLPAGKIFIKPNFLDSGMQEQSDKQDFFLFAGRLADYKGIDTLIEAFKLSGLPLKVIGDGPKHKDVQKKIEGAGNIELLGRLPFREVLDYIRRARCVVFTSECYENMPRVIIESFACGVPVVASDFGATKELVSDRVNGLLFEASNSKSLARKTGFLAKNLELCEKFGIGARAAYEQKFTPDINYKILMDIYRTAGANEEVTAD